MVETMQDLGWTHTGEGRFEADGHEGLFAVVDSNSYITYLLDYVEEGEMAEHYCGEPVDPDTALDLVSEFGERSINA